MAGRFTQLRGQPRPRLGRLNADGTSDTTFAADAENTVYTPRCNRMESSSRAVTSPGWPEKRGPTSDGSRIPHRALSLLTVDAAGSTITWLRSEASPEVGRATFELSTDGADYGSPLAATHRRRLAGHGAPFTARRNLFIRARGVYSGGISGGSGSVVQSVRNVLLPAPVTLSSVVSGNTWHRR